MRRFLRENDLTLVMFALFALSLIGQGVAGFHVYNDGQVELGKPDVGGAEYLRTGHFVEAVFENWESEFLQMRMYLGPSAGADSRFASTRTRSPSRCFFYS